MAARAKSSGSAEDAGAALTNPEGTEGDYLVSFWRTGQGLPNNTVNAILQTRDGFLWVGTAAGLARFDGLQFTVLGDETWHGLKDTPITALLEDQQGALWVGTQGRGVLRLEGGRVDCFASRQGLAGDAVTSLAQDASGTVWIGTPNGLSRWEKGTLSGVQVPGLPEREGIVALHAGGSGALWITTRSGVFRLQDGHAAPFKSEQLPQGRNAEFIGAYEDHSGNLWAFGATFLLNVTQGQSLNNFPSFSLASSRVWTICEQNNSEFWIGTSGRGLFRFHNGRFEVVGAREDLEHCDIRALHADRLGNLWIGTGGNGLARLRMRRLRIISGNEGLRSEDVSAIASDGGGGLWVGTADAGLWHWNGHRAEPWSGGGPLQQVTQIQTLCFDTQQRLWVGTLGAGVIEVAGARQFQRTTADGLADDAVLALAPARDNNSVWVGTRSGVLHRIRGEEVDTFRAAPGLNPGGILCLEPGDADEVLLGSENGMLMQCDGKNLVRVALPSGTAGKPIRCTFHDRRGRLWVGTWGGGAYCRDGEKWVTVTKRQGLGSEFVGMIAQSDGGQFWFGTDENLFKTRAVEIEGLLSGTREFISAIPTLSGAGLDGLRCASGWPATARNRKNALWLACRDGIFPLAEAENPGSEPAPPVILERVLVNNQSQKLPHNGPLKLGPGARSLDIEFTAINFTAPQKVRFRHKLENFDSEWVDSDLGRRAHYGPLPPGQYRFRVIAANAEGLWSETGASLGLVVTPPLWRAWWFICLMVTALVASVWAAARFISTRRLEARLRAAEQQHAMERERARIARDMHDEIGSKLTRISFLSEVARQNDSPGPQRMQPVEAIANTSRELLQSLDEIVWAVNPGNDNLEHLAGYLEQHAREYFQGTTCDCRIFVAAQLPGVPLSAELRHNVFLAFEEALNNCLKHAQAGKVTISMRVEPHAFLISVEDDGPGFDASQGPKAEQDGLRNMRERLRAVGGSCEIASRPGAGTRIVLRFPLTHGTKTGRVVSQFTTKK